MSSTNDLVSIVVPVYKAQDYLRACVESLLKQTYNNIEIILIEDHSPDQSLAICKKYVALDSRIRLIVHETNMGYGKGRNDGINAAQGKWIMFLDADDEYLPEAVERMVNQVIEWDAQIALASFYYIYEGNICEEERCRISDGVYGRCEFANICLKDLTWEFISYPCTKIYQKSFLDDNRIRLGEYHDGTFMIDALSHADRIAVVSKPLAHYNVREGTISRSFRPNMYEFFREVDNRIECYYSDNGVMDDLHRKLLLKKRITLVKTSIKNMVKYGKYSDYCTVFDRIRTYDEVRFLVSNKRSMDSIKDKIYLMLIQIRARFLLYLLLL